MTSFHDWTRCGLFYRRKLEERKGPRGGRRTAVRAVCVYCERMGPWVVTERAGSFTEELAVSRDALRALGCEKPREPTRDARMLLALADVIAKSETISFPFAVEFLPAGVSLGEAVLKAWDDCEDGFAMAAFLVAQCRRSGSGRLDTASRYDDGRVNVSLQIDKTHMTLTGPPEQVAAVLVNTVSREAVRKLAAIAEKKVQAA